MRYVPIEKMSKKARREYFKAGRGSWGALNPVTRKPPNPKAYRRKKVQRGENPDVEPFFTAIARGPRDFCMPTV